MLKTMLMTYYAKLSNITPEKYKLPPYTLNLFQNDLGQPLGLYIPTSANQNGKDFFVTANEASISILTYEDIVSGVTISLGGLCLTLVIYGNDEIFHRLAMNYTYRPKNLLFFKEGDVYAIQTTFPNWQGKDIWYSLGVPNAGIPVSPSP